MSIKQPVGWLDFNGALPLPHELETINYLVTQGKSLKLIPSTSLHKTADFVMDGIEWEMKHPKTDKYSSLEHLFREALKQSPNLVFDLRRSKGNKRTLSRSLENLFLRSRKARKLIIITDSKKPPLDISHK